MMNECRVRARARAVKGLKRERLVTCARGERSVRPSSTYPTTEVNDTAAVATYTYQTPLTELESAEIPDILREKR